MKSLRNRLRRAVLAVPVVATACAPQSAVRSSGASGGTDTGTPSATASSAATGSASGGFGHNLCADCEARGLRCDPWKTGCVTVGLATSTSGGTASSSGASSSGSGSGSASGSSGTSGNPNCQVYGLCPIICDCQTATFRVEPVPGSRPPTGELDSCQCTQGCPQVPDGGSGFSRLTGCSALVADAGSVDGGGARPDGGGQWDLTCYYYTSCNGGRRPAGLVERAPQSRTAVGATFAALAHLEAASVVAFRRMARELQAFGAPGALVQAARDAARDELRHTRLTRALAVRLGAVIAPVTIAPATVRSLLDFALENAREGCVGETFGAALACWQAEVATDAEIRRAAEEISGDETRHAELAWAIDAWLQSVLAAPERALLARARAEAIERLEAQAVTVPQDDAHWAGLPTAAEHLLLLHAMRREVWGADASTS